jgi:hypothetical protein
MRDLGDYAREDDRNDSCLTRAAHAKKGRAGISCPANCSYELAPPLV